MKVNVTRSRKARIEMLPLIDTVFLLLVFFIYAMLSMAVHRGLPVLLPTSAGAGIDRHADLSVTVRRDGSVFVDKVPVAMENLAAFLKDRARRDRETGVLLFADRRLSYQELFRVLDRIREAGIRKVSLQSEADREK